MTRQAFDLSLYLVIGSSSVADGQVLEVAEAAVSNGVSLVQLREKNQPKEAVAALARALKGRLTNYGVPLIINDFLDVALAVGADGLHLGQDDSALQEARRALGPNRILGTSAGNRTEADAVDLTLVDYVGVGPVYPTGSKADAGAAIGLEGLADMRRYLDLPLVAIGGIGIAQAAHVMACGVEGLAVVSAICGAKEPGKATVQLRLEVDFGRQE